MYCKLHSNNATKRVAEGCRGHPRHSMSFLSQNEAIEMTYGDVRVHADETMSAHVFRPKRLLVSRQRVAGFPGTVADLWGGLGNSSGKVRGASGEVWETSGEPLDCSYRGPKKHKNFFNINFVAPTQNTPFWAPRKKLMCFISWERTQKRDPHKLFRGDFGFKKGVPNGPCSATKSLVYCFFPALI